MTVVLVCRIPFEQFLKEGGAKYEYTWSGWNSAADKQLRATSSKSKPLRTGQAWDPKELPLPTLPTDGYNLCLSNE
ncbi:hypothetical protein M513_12437 [Trichuris suis]|uniref:Uncharacterized protein n=1 Tax=Trichuris suis TaxID=68888 RepID=A0A085LNX3_9BILA|nr:hypothetical protein M513_12437 [Trichuris suis]